ncbi:MAG: nucleotide exchange factor GrpE, partial [Kofleriaceae bacterium]|nr:nucleotide exchange factor GrpE [Kofleriaceae bacterium]
FDPAVHEAVSQAPSADHDPGTVITALQTGYMMEERLLRPALVVVSIAMPAVLEPESDDSDSSDSSDSDDESQEEPPKEATGGEETTSDNEESAPESKE